jgi:hypothetical protein
MVIITYHSIERAQERLGLNKYQAIRKIGAAVKNLIPSCRLKYKSRTMIHSGNMAIRIVGDRSNNIIVCTVCRTRNNRRRYP